MKMTDPNAAADPQWVMDALAGTDGGGNPLGFRIAAMFYLADMFGLARDYAFPEGSNASAAMTDQATSLAKLLTRQAKLADGNTYDMYDMIRTLTKAALVANIHINDNEPLSVNYVAPKPTSRWLSFWQRPKPPPVQTHGRPDLRPKPHY
jgi:hypothetical protein